jgi:DNA-binding transcriptional LysR family regulator
VVNRAQAIRRLADNRDDLTVMSMVPQDMGLEFLPFLNNPIVAVAPCDHPLSQLGTVRLQQLEAYTLLVREQGSGTRRACEEYFKEKRVHFTQTLEVASGEAQRECVSAGLGIALLTRHAVSLELATGLLKELPVEELPLYRSWCLVQAKARRQSPVALAFQTFIRTERSQISDLAERFAGRPLVLPANNSTLGSQRFH